METEIGSVSSPSGAFFSSSSFSFSSFFDKPVQFPRPLIKKPINLSSPCLSSPLPSRPLCGCVQYVGSQQTMSARPMGTPYAKASWSGLLAYLFFLSPLVLMCLPFPSPPTATYLMLTGVPTRQGKGLVVGVYGLPLPPFHSIAKI